MTRLFYISSATDSGFLGATVIEAYDAAKAIAKATALCINPGGEAAILEVPDGLTPKETAEMLSYKDRLVSKAELLSHGARRVADLPQNMQDAVNNASSVVCADCNQFVVVSH